ncbi:hypothetical protein U5A82_13945 [Sphingobium sp. CR2-8]|uniref:hypothetical protein n=1 Tax=Sphingobium sp. CR2-8 TaxID=1306534 RepID=UPI002DBDBBD0|nr:hypothetical protein [Sphingobium sp. CR2-8]MEC3911524.1 hypothetical protein [Sphingobium sp. CR2-8]
MNADEKLCPACAETIKAAAILCKHCGTKLDVGADEAQPTSSAYHEALTQSGPPKWAIAVGLIAVALVLVGVMVMRTTKLKSEHDAPIAAENEEKSKAEDVARRYVTKDFLDPKGAEFRGVSVLSTCVTGEVNGKNPFGAYTGFVGFYYSVKDKVAGFDPGHSTTPTTAENLKREYKLSDEYRQRLNNCIMGKPLDTPELTAATSNP